MPLRKAYDPNDEGKPWVGFHLAWNCLALEHLNRFVLSRDYCAGLDVFKPREMVSEFEAVPDHMVSQVVPDSGFPPLPKLSAPAMFVDPGCNYLTVRYEGTERIVAAVLIAPPESTRTDGGRKAFAVKCARWLQRGTSLVVINAAVPADPHTELTTLLGCGGEMRWRSETGLSANSYRVAREKQQLRFDAWPHALKFGEDLPTVPLWLEADLAVPLELERTFVSACRAFRIR